MIPTHASSLAVTPAAPSASLAHVSALRKISSASCSHHPGLGYRCACSRCADAIFAYVLASRGAVVSYTTNRVDVVP